MACNVFAILEKKLCGGIIGDTSLFVSLQHDSEELLMLRILRCDWLRGCGRS